jgi:hypothetical protein
MTPTTRRNILSVLASATAVAAIPAAIGKAMPDPIYAAITEQVEAHAAVDRYVDGLIANGLETQDRDLGFAVTSRQANAAKALVATAPTTMAGLRALEQHLLLSDEDLGYATMCGHFAGRGAVESLLAQRSRELAAQ